MIENSCSCPVAGPGPKLQYFGCPFPKGHATIHPARAGAGTRACLTHVSPRELIQLLFIRLGQGERGPDQTDPQGAGGGSGMHIFQSKNGSQPTSSAQHQPFPLFIRGLQGAIAAHLPSHHPHKGSSTDLPSQGWDQEGNIRRGIESKKSEEHQDQTESHVLVPPPNFMPLLHPPLPQKHQWVWECRALAHLGSI